jgi:hypothetical protein
VVDNRVKHKRIGVSSVERLCCNLVPLGACTQAVAAAYFRLQVFSDWNLIASTFLTRYHPFHSFFRDARARLTEPSLLPGIPYRENILVEARKTRSWPLFYPARSTFSNRDRSDDTDAVLQLSSLPPHCSDDAIARRTKPGLHAGVTMSRK